MAKPTAIAETAASNTASLLAAGNFQVIRSSRAAGPPYRFQSFLLPRVCGHKVNRATPHHNNASEYEKVAWKPASWLAARPAQSETATQRGVFRAGHPIRRCG